MSGFATPTMKMPSGTVSTSTDHFACSPSTLQTSNGNQQADSTLPLTAATEHSRCRCLLSQSSCDCHQTTAFRAGTLSKVRWRLMRTAKFLLHRAGSRSSTPLLLLLLTLVAIDETALTSPALVLAPVELLARVEDSSVIWHLRLSLHPASSTPQ